MSNNPNQSHTERFKADYSWAKNSVTSVLDICMMNANAVDEGIFEAYIHEMKSELELLQFAKFMAALHRGYGALGIL